MNKYFLVISLVSYLYSKLNSIEKEKNVRTVGVKIISKNSKEDFA